MGVFKDKALQVTVVKKEDQDPPAPLTRVPDDTVEKIGQQAQGILQTAGALVLLYVGADTIRKVIIEISKK